MKKFFGILLAAVSALVLLPGCGGGGDDAQGVVTVPQYVNGTKTFVLGAGYMNIYVTGAGIDPDSADGAATSTSAQNVEAWIGIGNKAVGTGERARTEYTVHKTTNDAGEEEITSATLIISFENCSNETLREFFNFPTNADDDDNPVNAEGEDNGQNWAGTLTITLDFTAKSWSDGVKNDFKFFLVY